jgi:hypothetical protein
VVGRWRTKDLVLIDREKMNGGGEGANKSGGLGMRETTGVSERSWWCGGSCRSVAGGSCGSTMDLNGRMIYILLFFIFNKIKQYRFRDFEIN